MYNVIDIRKSILWYWIVYISIYYDNVVKRELTDKQLE
jgi:hypothetical protein